MQLVLAQPPASFVTCSSIALVFSCCTSRIFALASSTVAASGKIVAARSSVASV
jgi:hypothetical protein